MERRSSLSLKAVCLAVYLVALVASTVGRYWVSSDESSIAGNWGVAVAEAPIVVLLGGGDGDPDQFAALGPALAEVLEARVVAVRLPGREAKGGGEVDFAPESQARWVLEALPVGSGPAAHLLGFGYGGAVALAAGEAFPERFASVGMVSTPVSARYELLGDPGLNRAMAGFRLAWAWVGYYLTPHFGALDKGALSLAAAKADFAVDRERLAARFEGYEGRLFLARGSEEMVVSAAALEAFAKVQPWAVARSYPGGRGALLGENALALALDYAGFVAGVEGATTKADGAARFADLPGRRLDDWLAGTLLAVATFASEDLACIGGGLLASGGGVSLRAAILGCFVGIFLGDYFIFLVGRTLGASALELRFFRGLASPEKLERCARWFDRRGISLVVLTRFLPGSRVPTYFAAGVVKVGYLRFAVALLVASAVWTPILVGVSYAVGPRFMRLFEGLGAFGWVGIALAALCFIVGTRLLGSCLTWRGRRLLLSRWLRLTQWEFWPTWALYPPVVAYIAWLMARHRSVTLPSIVNPCMPTSGLVYESKSQILRHLQKHGAPVGRFEVIPLEMELEGKLGVLRAFMEKEGLSYPVVLKPDVGQRGQGVSVVKDEGQARVVLGGQLEDTIAQEFLPGVEYGVFYERSIRSTSGRVTSITDKRLIGVVGDGHSTLEELILRDERAVRMGRFFLAQFEAMLDVVLPVGERFALTSVGTHCRGALFLDGKELLTPELEAEVDRFSRVVEGFHFGRYDLRAPSAEAFMRGEGLRIIELNGLTSEPTSMYDPKHSVFFAWLTLVGQWRRIFELAKENRLAGHEPDSLGKVFRLARAHLRGATSRDLA